jgi:hypothetical protein
MQDTGVNLPEGKPGIYYRYTSFSSLTPDQRVAEFSLALVYVYLFAVMVGVNPSVPVLKTALTV